MKSEKKKVKINEEGTLFNSHDLTQGSIIKALLFASIPIIIANLLQVSFQLVDRYWVGQLGTEAVAAITISFPLMFVIMSLIMGVSIAGTILVGQYKGQKNQKMIDFISTQAMSIMLILALILGTLGYFTSEFLLSFFTTDALVLSQATSYLQITFLGIVFVFLYFEYQAILRGVGNVIIPMLIILGASILNFFIDPMFIMGFSLNGTQLIPAMGVSGAAYATILSQGLAGIIGVIILIRGKSGAHLDYKYIVPQFETIKRIFSLGFPSSIEFFSRSIGGLLITFIVSGFGTLIIAAYGTGQFIFSLVFLPALGLSIGTSTIISQCVGAKKIKRLHDTMKISIIISFAILTIIGVLLILFSTQIAQIFLPNSPEAIGETSTFINIIAIAFGALGVQTVIIGSIRGTGSTRTAMMLSISYLIISIILTWLLPIFLGPKGIWWAQSSAIFLSLIIAFFVLKNFNWEKERAI